ncbi:GNAT family N-acetyltransferase [Bengtsoniella intestinalis]|uniref:GNAT family N-acetyltransferase n=1 Tax=Bengtsoniella intestinalis TaxID=3073143 RepID=UPI00391FC28D
MNIGFVQQKNLAPFASLLLSQTAKAVEQGEPLLCLGAVTEDGVACGAIAGYIREGAWQLASLYMAPEYRRQGGASQLLRALLGILQGVQELHTLQVEYTITAPEHHTLAPFLEAVGFVNHPVGSLGIYGCTLKAVAEQPFFSAKEGKNPDIVPFSTIPHIQLRQTQQRMEQLGMPLSDHGLTSPFVDADVSVAYVQNGKIEAIVQVERLAEDQIHLATAWSNASPQILVTMLQSAFRRSMTKYPPHTQLTVHTATDISATLMKRLLPQTESLSRQYAYTID